MMKQSNLLTRTIAGIVLFGLLFLCCYYGRLTFLIVFGAVFFMTIREMEEMLLHLGVNGRKISIDLSTDFIEQRLPFLAILDEHALHALLLDWGHALVLRQNGKDMTFCSPLHHLLLWLQPQHGVAIEREHHNGGHGEVVALHETEGVEVFELGTHHGFTDRQATELLHTIDGHQVLRARALMYLDAIGDN